jgi:hypothetical protein
MKVNIANDWLLDIGSFADAIAWRLPGDLGVGKCGLVWEITPAQR